MTIDRRTLLGTAAAASSSLVLPRRARAQTKTIKIGVLNDQSGPYRDIAGLHSVNAAKLAAKDFGDGLTVEVITADHQNKPDIGAGIARQWIDQQGVDMILGVNTSSVALAVNNVCKEKNRAYINNGAATADLTGTQCTPVTIHWAYDVYLLAQSTAGALV
ncbi:MAG: ABC transporter substrate-binding protein, partial [Pseudomonadota bacterium]|nr:ABC transporter substrate-binding protein [Pseudomonadota bacterium]